MFRSSTMIRELVLNLAKVIFMLKHSVKLCRYMLLVMWQHVAEWRFCCVLCILHSTQHTRRYVTCCHITK